jgi:small GTP-binding protein
MAKKNIKKEELKYDVFICYSTNDLPFVEKFAEKLKQDGLIVWLDKWEIDPVIGIEKPVELGIMGSRNLLFIMTENSFGKDWRILDKQIVMFNGLSNKQRKFLPILVEECEIKETLKQFVYINYIDRSADKYLKILNTCKLVKRTESNLDSKKTQLKSVKILKGHTELIRRVVVSKNSKIVASASNDKTIRIWDINQEKCINVLSGHKNAIWAIAISEDGKKLISGSFDNTIRYWDTISGQCIKIIQDQCTLVYDIAMTPDGKYAASSHDFGVINVWNLIAGKKIATFRTVPVNVWSIEITPDGNTVISGSQNNIIEIWDVKTVKCINSLIGHKGSIQGLTLNSDKTKIISGSSDKTIKIWDLKSGRSIATLEGHTGKVWSVAVTNDGQYIVSGSEDKTIRIWEIDTGRCIKKLEGHYDSVYSVVLTQKSFNIVSTGRDKTIRIWDLLTKVGNEKIESSTIRYTNAKVLIVGDSGVGKSGLAIRLAENRFENTISTDAVWATQLKLALKDENIDKEIWLWDFGGQPDYRLVHQLFMDETSLALLVFNPQNENPFESLYQWNYELQRAARRPFKKYLVSGRIDRGGLIVSRETINSFSTQNDFSGYYETSANTGSGCQELYDAILNGIDWDEIPWTSSPKIFNLLKKEIIKLKDEGKVLLRLTELKQQLEMRLQNDSFTFDELLAVIGLLAGPGIVWQLEFGNFILLQPEKINAYAAAVIRKVRQHPEEIGCISEEDVLNGILDYQDLKRLNKEDEQIVLYAMHQNFIYHGLCLREQTDAGTLLIFPAYFKRERRLLEEHPEIFVTYSFNGNLDEIYSTLIIRLHHTSSFHKHKLWRYAADFVTEEGKKIGIKMNKREEGNGEIAIYFEPHISDETKVTFIRYVHEHLRIKTMDIIRFRHYVCPNCNTPVENKKTARDRLLAGKKDIICVCCEKRIPLWDLIEEKFASDQLIVAVNKLTEQVNLKIDNESKELILVGHIFAIAGEAGQIFRPTSNSDWGIDGEIEFKNDHGNASGKRIYLQLKSGDSYLKTRKIDNAEIFTISNPRHIKYWKSQAYPVMLIIRNSEGLIRWMDITEYLKNRSNDSRQIIFKGESFSTLSLLRLRDKILDY